MTDCQDKHPLEIRIERLERQNRLFRRGIFTCLIALVSVVLMAQTKHPRKTTSATTPAASAIPDKIEAGSFILKDSTGKVRAELSMAGTGPTSSQPSPAASCRWPTTACRFSRGRPSSATTSTPRRRRQHWTRPFRQPVRPLARRRSQRTSGTTGPCCGRLHANRSDLALAAGLP